MNAVRRGPGPSLADAIAQVLRRDAGGVRNEVAPHLQGGMDNPVQLDPLDVNARAYRPSVLSRALGAPGTGVGDRHRDNAPLARYRAWDTRRRQLDTPEMRMEDPQTDRILSEHDAAFARDVFSTTPDSMRAQAMRADATSSRREPERRERFDSGLDRKVAEPFYTDTLPGLIGGNVEYRARPWPIFGRPRGQLQPIRAAATASRNRINVDPQVARSPTDQTLTHESGHVFDLRDISPTLESVIASRFPEMREADSGAYAATGTGEHFAEAWAEGLDLVRSWRREQQMMNNRGEPLRFSREFERRVLERDEHLPGTYEAVEYLLRQPAYADTPVMLRSRQLPVRDPRLAQPDAAAVPLAQRIHGAMRRP